MIKKLIVFDVDGVLLDNKDKKGGFKDILIMLGKNRMVKKLDEEYQKVKNKGPWGLEKIARLYRGFFESKLKKVALDYCKKNLRKRAKDTIKKFKCEGYLVGSLSSNPQFMMDILAKLLLLDFAEGTPLEIKNNRATGGILKTNLDYGRYRKAEILKKKIAYYNLKKENVIVVGDSITDLPMVEVGGFFIAFLPKEKILKEKADKIVENFQQIEELL